MKYACFAIDYQSERIWPRRKRKIQALSTQTNEHVNLYSINYNEKPRNKFDAKPKACERPNAQLNKCTTKKVNFEQSSVQLHMYDGGRITHRLQPGSQQ